MRFHRKPLLVFFSTVFVVLIVWDMALQISGTTNSVWNYLYNAGYSIFFLGAAWLGIRYARWFGYESAIGKALLFIGLGIGSWGVGLWVWLFYNFWLEVEVPFPSLADVFFSLFYPLVLIGGWYFITIFQNLLRKGIASSAITYSAICVTVVFAIVFGVFIQPVLSQPIPMLEKVFTIAYPLGDMLLILLIFMAFWASGGNIHRGLLFFIIGLFSLAAADSVYVYRTAHLTYWNGDISDLLFTIGSFIFSMAIIDTIDGLIPSPSGEEA